jgi:DegV family protein with EDD domain
MPDVAIVVDTTHYMPRELVEAQGMHEVSLYVNAGDSHEREIDMPDFDAFYERLRSSAQLPTTSQPSIGDFLAVYEPLVEDGRDLVSIHISGGISGTVEAARQAAADLSARKPQRRIEVVGSCAEERSRS